MRRPTKKDLVVGILILSSFAVGAVCAVLFLHHSGDVDISRDSDPGLGLSTARIDPNSPGSLTRDGVKVELEAGSVAEPATLAIGPSSAKVPRGASIVGGAVEIELDQKLQSDATIRFARPPSNRSSEQPTDVPAFLDRQTGKWMAVDEFKAEGSDVVGRTPHFTPFGLLRFGAATRSYAPSCSRPLDEKVLVYPAAAQFKGDELLLLACAEADGRDAVRVKIVNNRDYLMPIRVPLGAKSKVDLSSTLSEGTLQLLQRAATTLPKRTVLLPGGGQLTLSVPVGSKPSWIEPDPDVGIAAFGLLVGQIEDLGLSTAAVADAAKCAYRSSFFIRRSSWFNAGEIMSLIVDCFSRASKGEPKSRLAKTAKKIVKLASRVLLAVEVANLHEANADQAVASLGRILVKPPTAQDLIPPLKTSGPIWPAFYGSSRIHNADGYTYRLDYDVTVEAPVQKNFAEDRPGQTSVQFPVSGSMSVTNTTPGREAPRIGNLVLVGGLFESSRPVCRISSLSSNFIYLTIIQTTSPGGEFCILPVFEGDPPNSSMLPSETKELFTYPLLEHFDPESEVAVVLPSIEVADFQEVALDINQGPDAVIAYQPTGLWMRGELCDGADFEEVIVLASSPDVRC